MGKICVASYLVLILTTNTHAQWDEGDAKRFVQIELADIGFGAALNTAGPYYHGFGPSVHLRALGATYIAGGLRVGVSGAEAYFYGFPQDLRAAVAILPARIGYNIAMNPDLPAVSQHGSQLLLRTCRRRLSIQQAGHDLLATIGSLRP